METLTQGTFAENTSVEASIVYASVYLKWALLLFLLRTIVVAVLSLRRTDVYYLLDKKPLPVRLHSPIRWLYDRQHHTESCVPFSRGSPLYSVRPVGDCAAWYFIKYALAVHLLRLSFIFIGDLVHLWRESLSVIR